MRCVEGALGLGGHVVIGVVRLVVRFHHAYAIPNIEFFPSGYCSPIVHLLARLYSVIVNVICNQIVAHLHRENGLFEVLSLHFLPSDRMGGRSRQRYHERNVSGVT